MAAFNPVIWFEIYADDLARARAFYETVLDVTLEPMPNPNPGDDFQMLAFPSDMANGGAGGKLHQAKASIGEYGHIALAFDTEGNMIGLHSLQ